MNIFVDFLVGKIPAGLVNKVNEKQPMYAGVVRDKLEERYMYQDPPSEGDVKILAARKYPSVIENSSPSGADAETSGDDKSKIDSQAVSRQYLLAHFRSYYLSLLIE